MKKIYFPSFFLSILTGFFIFFSGFVQAQDLYTQTTKLFIDSARDNRPVKMEKWEPRDSDSAPLVLLSHGTGGNRTTQSWIAKSLVQEGYIVMAFDHYGNTFDNPIPKYFVSYWERPLDATFLLNQL